MPAADLVTLFAAPLNRLGIPYMVTGAVAAIMYGEPRLTNDIDLVVELGEGDADALQGAFPPPDYYVPPPEVIRIEARRPLHGHFNVIHTATALKADFYPSADDPLHRWALPRRAAHDVEGNVLWLAPVEYVIVRKLEYLRAGGSDKHLRDIRAMLRESPSAIDDPEFLGQVTRLALEREWKLVDPR